MPIKYVGSKSRFVEELVPIITAERGDRPYLEPFVGSASVILNVPGGRRMASDRNHYMIAFHRAIQAGWKPPADVPYNLYRTVKANPGNYPKELVAFIAIACSFGGKWWGGYARGNDSAGRARNFAREQHGAIMRDAPKYTGIEFIPGETDYRALWGEAGFERVDPIFTTERLLIYCDPPYYGTLGYQAGNNSWNRMAFFNWCDRRIRDGHRVLVSEYNAPDGWECIWEKTVKLSIDDDRGDAGKMATEKLFRRKP